jgi:hypothetical protein
MLIFFYRLTKSNFRVKNFPNIGYLFKFFLGELLGDTFYLEFWLYSEYSSDKQNQLLDVRIYKMFKALFNHHSIMNYINNKWLTLNVI